MTLPLDAARYRTICEVGGGGSFSLMHKKTARGLATRGRLKFRETLLGFFERGLGGGEAGYWHAER